MGTRDRGAPTDDIVVIARDLDAVPERSGRLGDVEDQGEELEEADDDGDEDGDDGEDDRVVEDGDLVFGCGGGGVESHHQGAVDGVEEAHADCSDS